MIDNEGLATAFRKYDRLISRSGIGQHVDQVAIGNERKILGHRGEVAQMKSPQRVLEHIAQTTNLLSQGIPLQVEGKDIHEDIESQDQATKRVLTITRAAGKFLENSADNLKSFIGSINRVVEKLNKGSTAKAKAA